MKFQDAPLSTLDVTVPVGPQIYLALRQRIVRNELRPGSRISESEIAKEYQVSRQPVREAFIKLSEQGLVEVRPQRGTFVSKVVSSEVLDAQFVRAAIEVEIVKCLTVQRVEGLVGELRYLVALQRKVSPADPERFFKLDEAFHRLLAEGAGKSHAWNTVESVKAQMDRVRFLAHGQFQVKVLAEQHSAIVEAIAVGDSLAAEEATRRHLGRILDDLPVVSKEMPEFFQS